MAFWHFYWSLIPQIYAFPSGQRPLLLIRFAKFESDFGLVISFLLRVICGCYGLLSPAAKLLIFNSGNIREL